jgi:hypothetical protein
MGRQRDLDDISWGAMYGGGGTIRGNGGVGRKGRGKVLTAADLKAAKKVVAQERAAARKAIRVQKAAARKAGRK